MASMGRNTYRRFFNAFLGRKGLDFPQNVNLTASAICRVLFSMNWVGINRANIVAKRVANKVENKVAKRVEKR